MQKMHDKIRTIIINCQVSLIAPRTDHCIWMRFFVCAYSCIASLRSECQRHLINSHHLLNYNQVRSTYVTTSRTHFCACNFSVNGRKPFISFCRHFFYFSRCIQIDSSAEHAQKFSIKIFTISRFAGKQHKRHKERARALIRPRRPHNANINCKQPTISHTSISANIVNVHTI